MDTSITWPFDVCGSYFCVQYALAKRIYKCMYSSYDYNMCISLSALIANCCKLQSGIHSFAFRSRTKLSPIHPSTRRPNMTLFNVRLIYGGLLIFNTNDGLRNRTDIKVGGRMAGRNHGWYMVWLSGGWRREPATRLPRRHLIRLLYSSSAYLVLDD